MFKINKKGQAFSTFQLLIAAVVALAILGVLLPMITNHPPIDNDPINASKELIRTQITNRGTLIFTKDVRFDSSNTTLSAESVVEGSGLNMDQVTFTNGGLTNEFTATGNILRYNLQRNSTMKIGILCSEGKENLKNYIENEYSNDKILDGGEDIISTLTDDESLTVCVIFPKRA